MLLDNAIDACANDDVPEIRTMAHTLSRWRNEILNHHRTGASNGPTEGLNFCAKQVKRAGRGFTNFEHYKLRVLLHAGGVTWPTTDPPTTDHFNASPLKPEEPGIMASHRLGTREEWLAARLELLQAEKELTRRSDELARQRLPWVRIDEGYRFATEEGNASLRPAAE